MVQNEHCSITNPNLSSYPMVMSEHELEEKPAYKDMANFDHLPLEVKEVIFLYLSPRDLKQCSLVCSKWSDIVNSNRVWLKICEVEGLSKKKVLEESCSMIENPMKHYSYSDEKLGPKHWRSHFNRYRFVQKNWKNGYYVLYRLPLKPILLNEHCIVEHAGSKMIIYSIHGLVKRFCSVDLASPDSKIDTIIYKNDYLVYTQNRNVVCLKRYKDSYKKMIQVVLETGNCNQPRNDCMKSQFTIRISDKFIIVQDPLNPCMLSFFETNDGSIRRQVDLHKALGNLSLFCTCLEVYGDMVFLGYRIGQKYYIGMYDYGKDVWEGPFLSIQHRAVELYVSQKILCAKLCIESRDFNQLSQLCVWLRDTNYKLGEYCANKHVPVVLTENDVLIYSFRDEITVRKLRESSGMSFSVSPSVMNICMIWDKFLVIHDEKGVSVWDAMTGKKIVSPLRSESCIAVCASNTNILLRCEDDRFLVVGYW